MKSKLEERYSSFSKSPIGNLVETGNISFEDIEKFVHENKLTDTKENEKIGTTSGKQELYEMIFNQYC